MNYRRPSLPPLPDLSHLTEEERQIIEGVILRQKQEEEKNIEIVRSLEREVQQYENELDSQNKKQSSTGVDSKTSSIYNDNSEAGLTCELCLKTKFADGIGNCCHYCKRRTCTRCGCKFSMKPSKFLWSCRLCKKKQELLAKSGQWYHGTQANPVDIDIGCCDRIHKQNVYDINLISRTFDDNFQRSQRVSDLYGNNNMKMNRQNPPSDVQNRHIIQAKFNDSQLKVELQNRELEYFNNQNSSRENRRLPSIPQTSNYHSSRSQMSLLGTAVEPSRKHKSRDNVEKAKYHNDYSVESVNKAHYRTNSEVYSKFPQHNRNQKQNPFHHSYDPLYFQEINSSNNHFSSGRRQRLNSKNLEFENGAYFNHSMSQENISTQVPPRPTKNSQSSSQRQLPQITNDMIKGAHEFYNQRSMKKLSPMQYLPQTYSPPTRIKNSPRKHHVYSYNVRETNNHPSQYDRHNYQQVWYENQRNDSLSSDPPSEPNILKRPLSGTPPNEYSSVYSSYTDTLDYNRKSTNKYSLHSSFSSSEDDIPTSLDYTSCDGWDHEIDSMSEKDDGAGIQYKEQKNHMPPSRFKNEQPATWKLSRNKRYMIGHLVLRKQSLDNSSSKDVGSLVIGLKIIGGKMTSPDHLSAIITKVKRGSIADVIGNLVAGDEVLALNGRPCENLTYEEVNDIILESKYDPEIELVVKRYIDMSPVSIIEENKKYSKKNPLLDDGLPKIQIKLLYSKPNQHLLITLVKACHLVPSCIKPVNSLCSTFVKMYLLPDRNEQSYRRSRLVLNSNNPKWNQTFVFPQLKLSEIRNRDLEIVVYDYDKETEQVDIIGELLIELGQASLSDSPFWYSLAKVDDTVNESDVDDVSSDALYDPVNNFKNEYYAVKGDRGWWEEFPSTFGADSEYRKSSRKIMKDNARMSRSYAGSDLMKENDFKYDKLFQMASENSNKGNNTKSRKNRVRSSSELVENNLYSEEGPYHLHQGKNKRDLVSNDIQSHLREFQPNYEDFNYENNQNEIDDNKGLDDVSESSEISKTSLNPTKSEHVNKDDITPVQDNEPEESVISTTENIDEQKNMEISTSQSVSEADTDQKTETSHKSKSESKASKRSERSSTAQETTRRKRRPSIGQKFSTVLGFSKKNSNASNLDKKPRPSFQRCEEVIPAHIRELSSNNSISSCPDEEKANCKNIKDRSKISVSERNETHVEIFVEGLGPGQLVGRQVLGMPCLGEIQLSFIDRKGHLEVEVIRARNLVPKNNGKLLPQPYVKVHLLEDKMLLEKQRTPLSSRKTLDPLFQHQISFGISYKHKILQVIVWGDYGRMEKKSFMGICDIVLGDLNLSSIVFGWYKLFGMSASNAHHHCQKQNCNASAN